MAWAAKAAFYVEAFGAEIATAMPVDDQGRTMHVHLHVNGASLMLSEAFPERGHVLQPPQAFALMLMVDDIDARYAQAVAVGATAVMLVADMFWGGSLRPAGRPLRRALGDEPAEALTDASPQPLT